MATKIIAPGNLSDYSSCRVKITVSGGCNSRMMRKETYTKIIPYSCLSQTIQGIHRLGGKITTITLLTSQTPVAQIECIQQTLSTIAVGDVKPSENPAESNFLSPQSPEKNHPEDSSEWTKPTTVLSEAIAVSNSGDYTFTDEW